jgi:L,D-peptidoglycan transpeptidase YkuD (ErfK/YbiS/YcfS/YnhG family)
MKIASDKSASQQFQGGTISYTPPHIVAGKKAIEAKAKLHNLVAVNDFNCRLVDNGCVRTYKPSSKSTKRIGIYWSAKTGARSMDLQHHVYKKFAAARHERGIMGCPTADTKCGLKSKGCVQFFQKGTIAYSPSTDARILTAQMNYSWKARGSQNGTLGYPLQDAVNRSGKITQVFQGGSLVAARVGAVMYPKNECWAIGAHKTRYAHNWANRISFTIAETYGTSKASFINCVRVGSVYKQEWKTGKATVGLKGFKRPGVASGHTQYRWSPQGSFTVHEAFGEGNPGTDLKYKKLNKRSRWSGTLGSSYNKYYEAGSVGYERWPDENMWFFMRLPTGDYRQGAVIDYNRGPGQAIQQGAGFAIFLHANPVPTAGCIALDLQNVVRYLKTADPGDRIIMGVRQDIFKA